MLQVYIAHQAVFIIHRFERNLLLFYCDNFIEIIEYSHEVVRNIIDISGFPQ